MVLWRQSDTNNEKLREGVLTGGRLTWRGLGCNLLFPVKVIPVENQGVKREVVPLESIWILGLSRIR